MLAAASRARAALEGRDFVLPDDVKALAVAALSHRVVPTARADIEGFAAAGILRDILERTPAPR
jgi:MoxR-like ATPase